MEFDLMFCVAYLKHESNFQFDGFDWDIKTDQEGLMHVSSEYWDRSAPSSNLFSAVVFGSGSDLIMQKDYVEFTNLDIIDKDITYKVISTLCIEQPYKWVLFVLKKLRKSAYNKQMFYMKHSLEKEYFSKLIKAIELYDNSELLYEFRVARALKHRKTNKGRRGCKRNQFCRLDQIGVQEGKHYDKQEKSGSREQY